MRRPPITAAIKAMHANLTGPRPDSRAWAKKIIDRIEAGEEVPDIAMKFALEALGMPTIFAALEARNADVTEPEQDVVRPGDENDHQ